MKDMITIDREVLEELDDLLPRIDDDDPIVQALRDLLYKKIRPLLREPCPACAGRGRGWSAEGEYVQCETCQGQGTVHPYDARQEALELIALMKPYYVRIDGPPGFLIYPEAFDPRKIASSVLGLAPPEIIDMPGEAPPVVIFKELRQ
jgi:hypothetical protein